MKRLKSKVALSLALVMAMQSACYAQVGNKQVKEEKIKVVNEYFSQSSKKFTKPIEGTKVKVKLNNQELDTENLAIQTPAPEYRTLVPLRVISEELGADVDWNQEHKIVTIKSAEDVIYIKAGTNEYVINGKKGKMDVVTRVVNDRALVPIRLLAELFNFRVDWDGDNLTVNIYSTNYDMNNPVKEVSEKEFIKNLNNFSIRTFSDMIKTNKGIINGNKTEIIDGKNLIYSPFSYSSAFNTASKFTNSINDHRLLNPILRGDSDKIKSENLSNKTMVLVNKGLYGNAKSKSDKLKVVNFPEEAENATKELQKDVLGGVLGTPRYDSGMSGTIINATRFLGYWTEPFSKEMTYADMFTKADGNKNEINFMSKVFKGTKGFEDNNVQVVALPVTTENQAKANKKFEESGELEKVNKNPTGQVYLIAPKVNDLSPKKKQELITKVGTNLVDYITKYKQNGKNYDKINLSVPKIKTKTTLDLLRQSDMSDYGFRNLNLLLYKNFKSETKIPMKISNISQVALFEMDEDKVDAKAVTDISTTSMSLDEKVFDMEINNPYFIVTTSNVNGQELITFMNYIGNPEQAQ